MKTETRATLEMAVAQIEHMGLLKDHRISGWAKEALYRAAVSHVRRVRRGNKKPFQIRECV